jgi:hypothetical protein
MTTDVKTLNEKDAEGLDRFLALIQQAIDIIMNQKVTDEAKQTLLKLQEANLWFNVHVMRNGYQSEPSVILAPPAE